MTNGKVHKKPSLAALLNKYEARADAAKGVADIYKFSEDAPEDFFEDIDTFLDRGHSDENFTYYAEKGTEAARWNHSECEWEPTRHS